MTAVNVSQSGEGDIVDTYAFDNYYEIQVERCVHEQVYDLFCTIPEFIDVDISF